MTSSICATFSLLERQDLYVMHREAIIIGLCNSLNYLYYLKARSVLLKPFLYHYTLADLLVPPSQL